MSLSAPTDLDLGHATRSGPVGYNAGMADHRRFELDELTNRPGTYFNPNTEILLVVDDSPDVDHELFEAEEVEDAEWVLISDEAPLDELRRDELIERFQVSSRRGGDVELLEDEELDDELDDEDDLEPDELE